MKGKNISKRVLVAGATGYLGRFVAKEFKDRGYFVRILARKKSVEKLKKQGEFLEPAIFNIVDEIFTGEVTDIKTLEGVCDDVDIVFSSVGITRQRDGLTFMDVDFQGNKNLLDLAIKANVKKFIFISSLNAHLFKDLDIGRAREKFVKELEKSGIDYAVVRPTGFFSDSTEFLKMARKGRVYILGNGNNRVNPIHGSDLAKVCVDAAISDSKEIPAGGPDVFSYHEIANLAFKVLGKKPKITKIPIFPLKVITSAIKIFSGHYYTLASFFLTAMQNDFIAPKTGTHHLEDYYKEYLKFHKSRN